MNSKANFSHPLLAAIAALVCAAAPGCKSDGNSSELLERELRCQEDRIFRLEGELDDMCYALESARRENHSLKQEMSGGDKGPGGQYTPSGVKAPTSAPKVEVEGLDPIDSPMPDTGSDPAPAEPTDEAPRFQEGPVDEAPRFESSMPILPIQQTAKRTSLKGDARHITKLILNRQLTGGWNPDGKHGDEGVFVAFEPRDAKNQLVEAVGEVSIVVLDPAQTGAAARVARWDFATDEVALKFRKGPLGRGLQFELPWPSKPPISRDLRLFVRMTTPDGRKVEADTKFRITPYDGWSAKPVSKEETVIAETIVSEPRPASRVVTRPKRARRPGWAPNR